MRRNVQNSIKDLRSLMAMQLPNGMVPEMIFYGSNKLSWLARKMQTFWYSSSRHTDITQMPILPFALRAIFNATQVNSGCKGLHRKAVVCGTCRAASL